MKLKWRTDVETAISGGHMDYHWQTTSAFSLTKEEAALFAEKQQRMRGGIWRWIMSMPERTRAAVGGFFAFAATILSSAAIGGILALTFS